MRSPSSELPIRQAVALGMLQGPAELLPISSSAHTSAIPWLLGWSYGELDPEVRKSFEVALHTGGACAMVIALRPELAQALRELDAQRLLVLGSACLPPAVIGYALGGEIERRLGAPQPIALALLAGAALLAIADRAPGERSKNDAGPRDGLWLGAAQACALVPGVSRAGATMAAGRILGFRPADAKLLSDEVALPVLVGAAALKGLRLRRRGLEPRLGRAFLAGAAASFASTLLSAAIVRGRNCSEPLTPYAVYRALLASGIIVRVRRGSAARRPGRANG